VTLDRAWAEAFAREWIGAWNARDIDRVVSHYAPGATFISPVAERRLGAARVIGRDALRTYWSGARQYHEFHFELEHCVWDEPSRELVLYYRRSVNGEPSRASEFFRFDEAGTVIHGEAMYGATRDH
jgi:hypothetical protein